VVVVFERKMAILALVLIAVFVVSVPFLTSSTCTFV